MFSFVALKKNRQFQEIEQRRKSSKDQLEKIQIKLEPIEVRRKSKFPREKKNLCFSVATRIYFQRNVENRRFATKNR